MNWQEYEDLLRAEVEEAKAYYEGTKRALDAFLNNNDRHHRKYLDQEASTIAVQVRKAVNQFNPGKIFGIEDVFIAMDDLERDFGKTKCSISNTLSRMIREGKLEKPTRKTFRRVAKEE
jgi:hypothetical protein